MQYDVIVVGGGHAGVEAAAAASRMGAKTLLITMSLDNLGKMSCNPSIGGVAKGTIVKEIDALDGLMAKAIDRSGTHFRILNASKGPAVWSPRAQADRKLYQQAISELLNQENNLTIQTGEVTELLIEQQQINGVVYQTTDATTTSVLANSVILTVGTFLHGQIFIGTDYSIPAGRMHEMPSIALADHLCSLGFKIKRLKTGTPARLDKRTINFSGLELQPSDHPPTPFSSLTDTIQMPQLACYITHTNAQTHQIIRDNLHKSAMYSGKITGVGPRYCPSIEDKVVRFAHHPQHQIFLEQEGLDSNLIYPNGISTSLPEAVQDAFIHSIQGLEQVKILAYGYAIEYDFIDPRALYNTLETKLIKHLFFAGQINGTTGYEEAAGQGLVAGVNAALKSLDKSTQFVLGREESYIGVLIDDLVRNGTDEPYRMFSSRAEYRLSIRADNADLRLTPKGIQIGCVGQTRQRSFEAKLSQIQYARNLLAQMDYTPTQLLHNYQIDIRQDGLHRNGFELLACPQINWQSLQQLNPSLGQLDPNTRQQMEIESMYYNYLQKQAEDIELFQKDEKIRIPEDFDYGAVKSLSTEVREKLTSLKPSTIGMASRISGITPAAIMAILIQLKK